MKTLVLARSYPQYHGFTCKNPNGFILIKHPDMMKGCTRGTKLVKLEGCYTTKKPEEVEEYETLIRIYEFVIFSEASFKEAK